MTRDLEETLAGLGPGYREVVERVRAAYEPPRGQRAAAAPRGVASGWGVAYLVAASLLVFVGLSVMFREPTARGSSEAKLAYTVAYAGDGPSLERIAASQRGDGSWANDFMTQQNAAALRGAEGEGMRIAYKKAVRYLRSKGLRPLSDEELKRRGDLAAKRLASG